MSFLDMDVKNMCAEHTEHFVLLNLEKKKHGHNTAYDIHESRRLFTGNTISAIYIHV